MKINLKTAGIFLVLAASLMTQRVFAEEVTVTVKGMVCSFCAQGLKKTFSKNENVASVDVDLDHKLVKLKLKEGKATSDAQIETAITDSGFNVEKIVRDPSA